MDNSSGSSNKKNVRLGDLLVSMKIITANQLNYALEVQKRTHQKLGEVLIEENIITESEVIEVLRVQLGIPHVSFKKFDVEKEAVELINEKTASKYSSIPVKICGDKVLVAMTDPLNIFAVDDLSMIINKKVEPAIATKKEISHYIDKLYKNKGVEKELEEFSESLEDIELEDEESSFEVANAPVVKLIDRLIRQAVAENASDIHIEPFENKIKVRFRIDGDLREIMKPAKNTHSAISTRIKIMAGMDIAEKRTPQDGRIETEVDGREIDIRVSSLPTVYGEKIVMRILDKTGFIISKHDLGLSSYDMTRFESIIKSPNGIILVTGPTGSGKSTTLYTVLKELNDEKRNIVTVEDPVEYHLEGINHVQVIPKAGLTFASGLRAILRQDPDIVMIGEIRDAETASIAMRAAITGHLVLSTMHTNDTTSTLVRLVDMGIERYIVSSSLVGVVSQRLVKKICSDCAYEYDIAPHEKLFLKTDEDIKLSKGAGCVSCNNTGYKGRTAVYEIMTVTKALRALLNEGATIDELRAEAEAESMISLFENGKSLVIDKQTTVEELMRIAYSLD
jgi:type IV pilus assembly protein PilB